MIPVEVREQVRTSRLAQGKPLCIEDSAFLTALAAVLLEQPTERSPAA